LLEAAEGVGAVEGAEVAVHYQDLQDHLIHRRLLFLPAKTEEAEEAEEVGAAAVRSEQ